MNDQSSAAVRHAEWLVTWSAAVLTEREPRQRVWQAANLSSSLVAWDLDGSDVRIAEGAGLVVFFSGYLTNVQELRRGGTQAAAAEIVLQLIASRGPQAVRELRGPFAVFWWDASSGLLVVARDHIGLQPLYYSRGRKRWHFSPSPAILTRQAGVTSTPDAVALSEWLCSWYPRVEDTAYRDVKRLPPATCIRLRDSEEIFDRYWNPAELEELPRLTAEELAEFQPLLERVVARSMQDRSPGVFLSGGLDSISVAVAALDVAQRNGTSRPLALSLAFPDSRSNEEPVQRGVAQQLRLEQILLPLSEAAGPRGLLHESLVLSAAWPLPQRNLWAPAYLSLARRASERGCDAILTGRGGDEWLLVTPLLIPDLLKRGDLLNAWRVLQSFCHSHQITRMRDRAGVVWDMGCRPMVSSALSSVVPAMWRRRQRRNLLATWPGWLAPDPQIRREVEARVEEWLDFCRPSGDLYYRESRRAILHPMLTQLMEETQESGRRSALRVLHPYWDVDLLTLLHRVPPPMLMAGGEAKSLVRRSMARRLPGLGLHRMPKALSGGVVTRMMRTEGPDECRRSGGFPALAAIGVLPSADIVATGQAEAMARTIRGASRLWTMMSFENWLQPRR